MDVKHTHRIRKEIKFYLVFFCLVLAASCGLGDNVTIEQVDYENEKAVGVTFTTKMDVEKIRVFVGKESQTSVIGVIVGSENKYNFAPVIPFTPGQTYTIRKKNTEVLASFTIPQRANTKAAELLAIYPKVDTVPENLLKMYFEFAQPMQEVGNALDFIMVTNETKDTVIQPFLKLESELWNKERTVLTLWLDPGRIKTNLIPNRERGLPLTAGNTYKVQVDSSWKSRQGELLKENYIKLFHVVPRDKKKLNVNDWQMRLPDAGTTVELRIDFGEPMDAFLAVETMRIYEAIGPEIKGSFTLTSNQSVLLFTPLNNWKTGSYKLNIQSRLEDLAGNNLNRLFDTELRRDADHDDPKRTKSISFKIR